MLTDALSHTTRTRPVSCSDGIEITAWVDMLSRIGQKNGLLYDFISHDSSPRGARPQSGRTLLAELERERSRIARDLHAGAGQPLAGIKLNLDMLDDCAADLPPTGRDALNRLRTLADQALQQVRAVSHKLHPPEWQGLTIEEAIRHLVRSSGLAGKVEVDIQIHPLPEEPVHAVKVALYRCAQECISNVARHSEATCLTISLRADGSMFELLVQDNGGGFPMDSSRPAGIGLIALREHAADLGGTCGIASSSSGVRVVVRLPMDPD
jgi:two-component system, NarL family, sensor kinase